MRIDRSQEGNLVGIGGGEKIEVVSHGIKALEVLVLILISSFSLFPLPFLDGLIC